MELNDYQRESRKTALYPDVGSNAIYPTLGLVGEAGEVADLSLIHISEPTRPY